MSKAGKTKFLVCLPLLLSGNLMGKDSFGGRFRLGTDYKPNPGKGELFYDLDLNYKSSKKKKTRLFLTAESDSQTRSLDIEQAFLRYFGVHSHHSFDLGYQRSLVNQEGQLGLNRRLFSKHNIITEHLKLLAYRSIQPQLAWSYDHGLAATRVALSYPSSGDYNLQTSFSYEFFQGSRVYLNQIIQNDQRDRGASEVVGVFSLAVDHQQGDLYSFLEGTVGVDPRQSELLSVDSQVTQSFFGISSQTSYRFARSSDRFYTSSIRLAELYPNDLNHAERQRSIGGELSLHLDKNLVYSINGDTVWERNPLVQEDESTLNSRYFLELRRTF